MANLKRAEASSPEEDIRQDATNLLGWLQEKKPDEHGDVTLEVATEDFLEVVRSGDGTEDGYNRSVDFLKRRREKKR
jgi:hypothetical protein